MSKRFVCSPLIAGALVLALASCSDSDSGVGSLSGSVLGSPVPVSGARVTIEELGLTTRTSSQGFFTFANVPAGSYTITFDGRLVFDPSDNSVRLPRKAIIAFPATTLANGSNTLNGRPVFLKTLDAGTQIDTSGSNMGTIPAGTTITNGDGTVKLVFDTATTVTFADAEDTEISLTIVDVDEIPLSFPDGLISSSAVTLQPPGMTFSPAPRVIFPNWNELPGGMTDVPLYGFDNDTAAWVQFGTGTVDAEGETVVSDAGSGPTVSGWAAPLTTTACTTTVAGRVVDSSSPSTGIGGMLCTTVNGLSATTADDGTFSIPNVPVPHAGYQVLVNVTSLTPNSGFFSAASNGAVVVCDGTTDVGNVELDPDPADTTPPTVASIVPAAGAIDVADNSAVRVSFSENVSPGSIDASSFTVNFGNGPIAGSFGVNGTEVTFVPAAAMPLGSTGTVTITRAVMDGVGNSMASTFTSTFTTAAAAAGGALAIDFGGSSTVTEGQTTLLVASLLDATGTEVFGAQFAWSSDDLAVASVSSTGVVTGKSAGTATITASSQGVTDSVVVTVSAPSVDDIEVNPSTQTLLVGGFRQFSAVARDNFGATIPGVKFTWSSDNTSVATVDSAGNVTAVAAGMATISAEAHSEGGSAMITVVEPSSVSTISVTPTIANFDIGAMVQFQAVAKDSGDNVVPGVPFTWTSSDTNVVTISPNLGLATAVAAGSATITATSDIVQGTATANVAQNTTLNVVLRGGKRETDPLVGARVLRHDPMTGAFLGEAETDANGVAAFGDIGATTTSISVVLEDGKEFILGSLLGVPTGTVTVTLGSDNYPAAFFDVWATNIQSGSYASVTIGDYDESDMDTTYIGKGSAYFPYKYAQHLQPNGRISLLTVAADNNGAVGMGWALDKDPAVIDKSTLYVPTNNAPLNVPFTASSAVVQDGFMVRRSGVFFDNSPIWETQSATSGTVQLPPMPGANAWSTIFHVEETAQAAGLSIDQVYYGNAPSSVSVQVPDLSLENLMRNEETNTVSWTATGTGAASVDAFAANIEWQSEQVYHGDWFVFGDAANSSFTLPSMPEDLAAYVPGTTGAGFRVELVDIDNATGFSAAWDRLQSVGGNFEAVAFTANKLTSAERLSGMLEVEIVGNGTGTVTSNPPGIDSAQGMLRANFAGGTEVTLTFTEAPGSYIEYAECPSQEKGQPNDGLSGPYQCVFTVRESMNEAFVVFSLTPP